MKCINILMSSVREGDLCSLICSPKTESPQDHWEAREANCALDMTLKHSARVYCIVSSGTKFENKRIIQPRLL